MYVFSLLLLVSGLGEGGNNSMGGGLGGMSNPYGNVNPREAYKEQNERLKEMGFINEEANFDALSKTGGNVDAAVERLLNMLG